MTTTYWFIMCECKQHVSDLRCVCNMAFNIAKELLVCNNRLRRNYQLIVLLFSNHQLYNLSVSKHVPHMGETHIITYFFRRSL